MNAIQLASRAVFSAYVQKLLRPIEIVTASVLLLSVAAAGYLSSSVSIWWLLLFVPLILLSLIASVIWLIVTGLLRRFTPVQSQTQKREVQRFVGLVGSHADLLGLTKFGLIVRVIQDVIRRSDKNILSSTIDDSKELSATFKNVVNSFT